MDVHFRWLKEDFDKWKYCMYCGKKLWILAEEPVRVCEEGHVAITFDKDSKRYI